MSTRLTTKKRKKQTNKKSRKIKRLKREALLTLNRGNLMRRIMLFLDLCSLANVFVVYYNLLTNMTGVGLILIFSIFDSPE